MFRNFAFVLCTMRRDPWDEANGPEPQRGAPSQRALAHVQEQRRILGAHPPHVCQYSAATVSVEGDAHEIQPLIAVDVEVSTEDATRTMMVFHCLRDRA